MVVGIHRTDHVQGFGKFSLNFHQKMSYTTQCQQKEVWSHYTKWGLPAYLGYEKKKYISDANTCTMSFFPTSGTLRLIHLEVDLLVSTYEIFDYDSQRWRILA